MSDFVLDASVCLAWFLEASPDQKQHAGKIAELIMNGAVPAIPALFVYEVGSRLVKAQRAKEISQTKLTQVLRHLEQIPHDVHHTSIGASDVVQRAKDYNLSGYDAIYFDLAINLGVPIATVDKGILSACKRFKHKAL